MKLIEFFDRTYIINLPERTDRLQLLNRELKRFGGDAHGAKVQVPFAPRPEDKNGFVSKGVHGNYLSHLAILKEALRDGLRTAWVLEDDATFSRPMVREQDRIVAALQQTAWDLCFFGHSLTHELDGMEKGLVPHSAIFHWAHCYAVHSRVLPELVDHLEVTLSNPRSHPRGGRMYIDAAISNFRWFNPDIVTLVANPVMSMQRGSVSNIGVDHWYDRKALLGPLVSFARSARDEVWRRTGIYFGRVPYNIQPKGERPAKASDGVKGE
jgi:hypothetical protein